VDCGRNTADLLWIRQHDGRIHGRDSNDDCRCLCAARLAGVGMRRCKRVQSRTRHQPRQNCAGSKLRVRVSCLQCDCPPRWLKHHANWHAGWSSPVDPLENTRSADLGGCGQTAQGRHSKAFLDRHRGIAGGRSADCSITRIPRPRPGDDHSDDQTR